MTDSEGKSIFVGGAMRCDVRDYGCPLERLHTRGTVIKLGRTRVTIDYGSGEIRTLLAAHCTVLATTST